MGAGSLILASNGGEDIERTTMCVRQVWCEWAGERLARWGANGLQ